MAYSFEDIAKLRVQVLGDEAEKSMDSLQQAAKDVKAQIDLLEVSGKKTTQEYVQLKVLQKDIATELRTQRKEVDLNNASYNEMVGLKRSLTAELKKTKVGSDEWIATLQKLEPVNTKLAETDKAIRGIGQEAEQQETTWSKVKNWIVSAFAVTAIIGFLKQLGDFGRQVFDITAKFERYDTILKNTLGSQSEATEALNMIKEIAANTPISVDEMTDSYIRMVNRGLKPTRQEIIQLADLAASQGKSFNQLTEAVLDAMVGEAERLKEFGIKMKKEGDTVTLNFKGQTVAVKNNEKAILDAIVAMGAYNGVAGMTGEISKTLEGRLSNLGDRWDFFRVELGQRLKPVFYAVIDAFNTGIDVMDTLFYHIGRIGKIVGTVAGAWLAYNVAIKANSAIAAIEAGLMKTRQILMGQALIAKRALTGATDTMTITELRAVAATNAFNTALKANPIGLVISAIALLVTAYQTYKMSAEESSKEQDELNKKVAETLAPIREQHDEFNRLSKVVLDGNAKLEDRQDALDELKRKYPDNLKGIEDLKDAEGKLSQVLRQTNADFRIRANIMENEVRQQYNREKQTKTYQELIELENKLGTANKTRGSIVTGTAGKTMEAYDSEYEKLTKVIAQKRKQVEIYAQANDKIAKHLDEQAKKIQFNYDKQEEGERQVTDTTKKELKKRADEKTKTGTKEIEELVGMLGIQLKEIKGLEIKRVEAYKGSNRDIKEEGEKLLKDLDEQRLKSYNDMLANEKKLRAQVVNIFHWYINESKKLSAEQKAQLLDITDQTLDMLQRMIDESEGVMDQATKDTINFIRNLAEGDVVGSVMSFIGTMINGIKEVGSTAEAEAARLKKYQEELKAYYQTFVEGFLDDGDVERIRTVFDSVFDRMNNFDQLVRFDLGEYDSAIRKLEQEINIGEQIVKNYNTAVQKEGEYSQMVIENINKAYNEEVNRINAKYAMLDSMANDRFNKDNLAVQEGLNKDLLAFITNEQSKTSVMEEYASKRSMIISATALADQQIIDGMDQATIDAIMAARALRDAELSKLETWYTSELKFILGNEEQKRQQYTETEQLIRDAEDRIEQNRIEKAAADIQRNKDKNIELVNAEKDKNTALESEATRHNNELIRLGIEKDAALAASFNILKDLVVNNYNDMLAKALEMYNQGLITLDQLNAFKMNLNEIIALQGQVNNGTPVIPPNYDWNIEGNLNNLPRFEDGGFVPGGALHSQGGITLWDNLSGRAIGEIEGGEPILSRATYANNKALIDSLLHSSVHRNGAKINTAGGYYNYASPRYANGGILPSSGLGFARPDSAGVNQEMLKYMRATAEQVAAMRAEQNALLDAIARKPGGISLHELNDSMRKQMDVEWYSNF